jgi:hypothetical protein
MAAGLLVAALASCAGSDHVATAAPGTGETSVSVTDSSTPGPVGTASGVPRQPSDLPDGVYRTQLSAADLVRLDVDDPTDAGTWTLRIRSGSYRLDCLSIASPGVDCGNHDPSMPSTVELGFVRGPARTAWFIHDMARLSKLTGCVRHLEDPTGCGPEGGYHLTWRHVRHGIAFSNFVGLGDEVDEPALNVFTAQPWTRIS